MKTTYASSISEIVFKKGDAVVLGISPFNSYFSESAIAKLYDWSLSRFKNIWIFVPDAPTKFTLMALGYEENQAIKKSRRQCKYLFNKIEKAVDLQSKAVTLVNSEWLSSSVMYQKKLSLIYQLFDSNKSFREECLQCSRLIMSNYSHKVNEINDHTLLVAVNYLLAELPIFTASTDIFDEKSAVFCYHNNPPFIQRLFKDNLFGLVNNKQGLVTVTF